MLIQKNTVRNCEQNWKKWRCYPIFGDIHFPHEVLRLCHEKTGFNAKWVTNWPTIVRDVDNYWQSKVRIDATKIWWNHWHLITCPKQSWYILIYLGKMIVPSSKTTPDLFHLQICQAPVQPSHPRCWGLTESCGQGRSLSMVQHLHFRINLLGDLPQHRL